jgi:hypothetical protein
MNLAWQIKDRVIEKVYHQQGVRAKSIGWTDSELSDWSVSGREKRVTIFAKPVFCSEKWWPNQGVALLFLI